MRFLLIAFLFLFPSCSNLTAINHQQIINAALVSSEDLRNSYIYDISRAIVNLTKDPTCQNIMSGAQDINRLFCHIGGLILILKDDELINENEVVWLSVINKLSEQVTLEWEQILRTQLPQSLIGLRELIRRYVDNGNIRLVDDINIECDGTELIPLISCP